MTVSLRGHLTHEGSKRGERYAAIEVEEPYPHSAMVTFYGDAGRDDDDSLTADMFQFWGPLVEVACAKDRYGGLVSSPAKVRLASVDTLPKGQDAKQGLAGTEGSAVGEAETPEPNAAIANGSNDNGRG